MISQRLVNWFHFRQYLLNTWVSQFSPNSSNWADSDVNKWQTVSSLDKVILWAQDNLQRSPNHWYNHSVILNCVIRADDSFNQKQLFRWVLIMADYWLLLVSWKTPYQLRREAQVGVWVESTLKCWDMKKTGDYEQHILGKKWICFKFPRH